MTIKEFRKNLNNNDKVYTVNKADKSFVSEKQVIPLYRIRNGEKVKYIEKSPIDEIEREMISGEKREVKNNFSCDNLLKALSIQYIKTLKQCEKYTKLSKISMLLNLNEINKTINFCIKENKEISVKNMEIYKNIFDSIEKSEDFDIDEISKIAEESVKIGNGLLKKLIEEISECIPQEISELYFYKKASEYLKEYFFYEIADICDQIVERKKNIIENLSIALNDLLSKIEELRVIMIIENDNEENPPIVEEKRKEEEN